MCIKKLCILLILMLFCVVSAQSQESCTEICVDFRANSVTIDSAYSDNAVRMKELTEFLRNISQDSTINIIEVSFCGAASPEGSYQLNHRLAQGRLSALEKIVRNEVEIPDSIINYNDSYIPWGYLKSQIQSSDFTLKNEIVSILDEEAGLDDYHHPNTHIDSRIVKLKQLDNGKVWRQMNKLYFEQMRNACVVFVTYKQELPPVQEPIITPDTVAIEPKAEIIEVVSDTVPVEASVVAEEEWMHRLHFKTNAIGWVMGIANVAAEIDLAKHWSFAVPVYYSALNYFTSTVKFRTLAVQPELRYWFNEDNQKIFVGAHFGYAQYNVAVGGDYRYQDHDGNSPALGGGVSVGYRMPISKNNKWNVEFSLGVGAYGLHYDKFRNMSSTNDGLLVESIKKTYWGLDQVAVSFSYTFDLKKKGGKR